MVKETKIFFRVHPILLLAQLSNILTSVLHFHPETRGNRFLTNVKHFYHFGKVICLDPKEEKANSSEMSVILPF